MELTKNPQNQMVILMVLIMVIKDVDNPILNNAVKEFGNLRIRIGGSLQDQLLYNVGTALVTFGLNALYGRNKPTAPGDILWTGNWNSSNARDFIGYTITKGYKIEGWEFGNELCGGGVAAKVDATQYAADMSDLKILLSELYPNPSSLPKLSGPSGFFDREWFVKFVQGMYPDWLDIVSHHIYNLGPGVDPNLVKKMQDPYVLDNTAQTYKDIQLTVQSFSPWSSVWVSESGGAYNNGGKASHTFVDGFWYMDMLGMTSTFGHQVFCRQSLVGANYGLLNTTTMVPNPDYYSALLFHRLMGRGVLATVHNGSPDLRAYSHCSRTKPGITLLLINLSNSTEFNIDVTSDLNIYAPQDVALPSVGSVGMFGERLEYHLTPKDGDLNSTTVLLNGNPLEVTSSGEIPPMNPAVYNDSNPLTVAPSSIVFVVLSDFKAPACA
ncbi:hypothetical protein MRB53_011695 [Persea americana]|uniref:Uncharacterized protein n=1 Tax=Persea americana TaxID=3435 RepID=A0ACC2LW48_PERAE|nr:hypothetical protein MRB53_011695 [Persea americana]